MESSLARVFTENVTENVQTDHSDKTGVYEGLSSHLYRVLDVVGVSEEVREGYREWAAVEEILSTFICTLMQYVTEKTSNKRKKLKELRSRFVDKLVLRGLTTNYIFGSQYEGTTTLGLHSDIDYLMCNERVPVVENIDDAPVDGKALLMLSDDTKPGYVKLQSVVNRTKQTINEREITDEEDTDYQGRILLKQYRSTAPNTERHGPADTHQASPGRVEVDLVQAYRCRTVPSLADEWLHRPRPYQWPSQDQLQRMGSYGCFFVGVSHPKIGNKDTEWRISFSLQERDLMSSLNPTQHKCYVLLKMIKRDIIQPRVGKSLTSYHCKTCIWHLAEIRGVEQWTPNNLVSCILECLRLLLDWVNQENCPNYFIKEENMFDKLDNSTLIKLGQVLQELLSNDVQFLYEIKCDDLGMLLALSKSDRRLEEKKLTMNQYHRYQIGKSANLLQAMKYAYLFIDDTATFSERIPCANYMLHNLEHPTNITGHEPRDVKMAFGRLIPYIRFIIFQMKCSNTLHQIEWEKDNEIIQSLAREIQLCNSCELIPSRLLVSSLYLQCDKLDRCEETLQDCEKSLNAYVTSTCWCYAYQQYTNQPLAEKIVSDNLSFEECRRERTAACMTFLPSEANLVPAALRYEMYRSVYTPRRSRNDDWYFNYKRKCEYCWFDWIVVDSKVYLYFLKYIVHTKTNKPAYKQDAIYNLLHLIQTDPNLGHKETALNLLGWIFMQENRAQYAFACFCCSLGVRPLHNAAKWHMAILLHSLINT